MKLKSIQLLAAGTLAIAGSPAIAIEAPKDNAAPPRAEGEAADPAAAAEPEQKMAFLGVISARTPDILCEHLKLEPGAGVVVESVLPDGPAANAGITAKDIITRVGDDAVGDPAALSKAVSAKEPGDSVKIGLIRKGQAEEIEVTLGERPADLKVMAQPRQLEYLNLEGVAPELAELLKAMIEAGAGVFEIPEHGVDGNINEALLDIQDKMRKALEGIDALEIPGNQELDLKTMHSAKFKMVDDEGSVEIESKDGGREVTVRDKEGKVTWSGPWDSEQDRAAPPDDVRERIERLNIDTTFEGNGLRLRLNNGADDGE